MLLCDGHSRVAFMKENKIYSFGTDNDYLSSDGNKGIEFYKQNAEAIIAGFSTHKLFKIPPNGRKMYTVWICSQRGH